MPIQIFPNGKYLKVYWSNLKPMSMPRGENVRCYRDAIMGADTSTSFKI